MAKEKSNNPIKCENLIFRTLALIKQDSIDSMGKIIDIIYREGFRVYKLKNFRLSNRDLDDFAAISKKTSRDYTENVVALVLQTERCVKKWKDLMGPPSPAEARKTTIDSLRSQFGKDNVRNAVYGSNSVQDASDVSAESYFG
jgi:nucleoside diphosphate kinase